MQFLKRTRAALCCFALTPLVLFTGIGRDAMLGRLAPNEPSLPHEVSLPAASLDDLSLRNTLFDAPAAADAAQDSAAEQESAPALPSAHAAAAAADLPAQRAALPARPAVTPPAPAATTPRFFTINEVLAKRAAQNANGQAASVRLAAIEQPAIDGATAVPPSSASRADEPFGLALFRAPEGLLWRKWRTVRQEMASDAAAIEACRGTAACASDTARRFLALAEAARAVEGRARLAEVNRSVNQAIRYTTHLMQYGTPDLWSAPLATLGSGRGDCEDYAILKYALLRETGVAPADMKIVLLRDNQRREDHAVLAVMSGGEWMVLDNHLRIPVAARELTHYAARYALSESGVGLFAAPYAERRAREILQEIPSMEAALTGRDTARPTLRPSL
jgi:predicted transglutaminase-like cysteine proteinase